VDINYKSKKKIIYRKEKERRRYLFGEIKRRARRYRWAGIKPGNKKGCKKKGFSTLSSNKKGGNKLWRNPKAGKRFWSNTKVKVPSFPIIFNKPLLVKVPQLLYPKLKKQINGGSFRRKNSKK
jgi:hypothetical protein